jgi:glycosyltransferase involved in cell wall biosynthesis
VIIEAMACGTPIVATDCESGPAEILQNGEYGRLVAPGDANALAQALHETLDERAQHSRLEQRAQDFSVARVVEHYTRILLGSPA